MSRPSLASLQRDVDRIDGEQNAHERECAVRYTSIDEKLDAFKTTLDSNHRRSGRIEFAAWGVLVSVVMLLLGLVLRGGGV